MAATSLELRERRAGSIANARTLWTEAESREGGPTAEDKQAFDAAMDGADALMDQVTRLERLETSEAALDAPAERASKPLSGESRAVAETTDTVKAKRVAFRHWLCTGEVRPELRGEAARSAEYRDTVISTDAKGGYLITPVEISADIVRAIEDQVFIRQLVARGGSITTVTDAKSLGIRKLTATMGDANWTTEVGTVTEDTAMGFGRRDLTPQLLSKLALVSIRTLLLSTDAEGEILHQLAYKFGITEEKAFVSGTGVNQPLGVFTADASGISTARDVVAASATAFTGDNLIDMKFSLKAAYQNDPTTAWVVSREFVKRARKLKVASTTGGNDLEYIWQPGLTEGAPDRILGIPYYMSEYAPNTFTTGLYVAILGAFRYYRIAQVADTMIQRLVELYAATNQVGFIGRRWVDGAPVLEEAFARLKLA